jgi:dehydrogenase/reductase SDR family member 12
MELESLSGRTFVVTGANRGIGHAIAAGLAGRGGTVILACRDPRHAAEACAALIRDAGPGRVRVERLDVCDPNSIAAFAERLGATCPAGIDALVNNAGAWFPDRRTTADGVELTWATNVLGPYALTEALAPLLAQRRGRVVNVGSHLASGLDLDDPEYRSRPYAGFGGAYPASKQALLALSHAQAQRYAEDGVTVNVAEPEWTRTESHRHAPLLQRLVMNAAGSLFARTPQRGADTAVWLAADPALDGVTGRDWLDRREQPTRFDDPAMIARVWGLCEERWAGRTGLGQGPRPLAGDSAGSTHRHTIRGS